MTRKVPTGTGLQRVAIYCRVSSQRQATDKKHSLPAQDQACRDYIAKELPGAVIVENRHDIESASDPDARPQFDLLLEAADRHEFDILVVDIMDRLTRGGQSHFFAILERLKRAGVTLKVATEPFESGDIGEAMAGFRALFAKLENEDRVRRVMRAKRGRVASGKPLPGGHDLYGYRWTDATKTKRCFDDPDSQPYRTVRRIWDYFLHDPAPTLKGIATRLTAEGVLASRAYFGFKNAHGRWNAESIRLLLRNEEYWGGNNGMVKAFTFSRPGTVKTEPEEEVEIPAFAPAYVTPEEAARVHARLDANKLWHGGKRPVHDWMADGLLLHERIARCGECGHVLTPYTYKRPRADGSLLTVYRCQQRAMFGPTACQGAYISAEALDAAVVLAVQEHLGNGDYLRRFLDLRDRDAKAVSGRVQDIEQQIAAIHRKVENAAKFVTERGIDDPLAPDVLAQAKLAKEELPTLEERLRKAQAAIERVRNNAALREELTDWFEAWTSGFVLLSRQHQHEFLKSLGAEVLLWREGERTPRARLRLAISTTTGVSPLPMDVEANRAAFGDDAGVDTDGIFVDTEAGAEAVWLGRHTIITPEGIDFEPNSTVASHTPKR